MLNFHERPNIFNTKIYTQLLLSSVSIHAIAGIGNWCDRENQVRTEDGDREFSYSSILVKFHA